VQPPVFEANRGRGAHRVKKLWLVGKRAIVDERGTRRSLAVDQRGGPTGIPRRQVHRHAVDIDPSPEVGQPVHERERRVARGTRKGVPEIGWLRVRPQLY